jgi:hypothetical protein
MFRLFCELELFMVEFRKARKESVSSHCDFLNALYDPFSKITPSNRSWGFIDIT